MKAIKYWVASFSLITLIACTKSELESATETAADSATLAATSSTNAKWSTVTNKGAETASVAFAGEIKDDAITEDVMQNGLVLVFAKNANQVQSLPFQEDGAALRYWYYHVSQGSVFIQANAASKSANVTTAQDFAVVVLSKSQLETLESNGSSRDLLLGMSFEQVGVLLSK